MTLNVNFPMVYLSIDLFTDIGCKYVKVIISAIRLDRFYIDNNLMFHLYHFQ